MDEIKEYFAKQGEKALRGTSLILLIIAYALVWEINYDAYGVMRNSSFMSSLPYPILFVVAITVVFIIISISNEIIKYKDYISKEYIIILLIFVIIILYFSLDFDSLVSFTKELIIFIFYITPLLLGTMGIVYRNMYGIYSSFTFFILIGLGKINPKEELPVLIPHAIILLLYMESARMSIRYHTMISEEILLESVRGNFILDYIRHVILMCILATGILFFVLYSPQIYTSLSIGFFGESVELQTQIGYSFIIFTILIIIFAIRKAMGKWSGMKMVTDKYLEKILKTIQTR